MTEDGRLCRSNPASSCCTEEDGASSKSGTCGVPALLEPGVPGCLKMPKFLADGQSLLYRALVHPTLISCAAARSKIWYDPRQPLPSERCMPVKLVRIEIDEASSLICRIPWNESQAVPIPP